MCDRGLACLLQGGFKMSTDIGGAGIRYTYISPSAFSRRAVVSYWRKYVHEILVNRFNRRSKPAQEKCG